MVAARVLLERTGRPEKDGRMTPDGPGSSALASERSLKTATSNDAYCRTHHIASAKRLALEIGGIAPWLAARLAAASSNGCRTMERHSSDLFRVGRAGLLIRSGALEADGFRAFRQLTS